MQALMQYLTDLFVGAQGWLFDSFVKPVLFALGLGSFVEMSFEGIEFVLLGLIELAIAYTLMRPGRTPATTCSTNSSPVSGLRPCHC